VLWFRCASHAGAVVRVLPSRPCAVGCSLLAWLLSVPGVMPCRARRWRPGGPTIPAFDFGFWVWHSRCLPVLSLVEPFLTSPPPESRMGVRSGTAEPRGPKGRSEHVSPTCDRQSRTMATRPVLPLCAWRAGAVQACTPHDDSHGPRQRRHAFRWRLAHHHRSAACPTTAGRAFIYLRSEVPDGRSAVAAAFSSNDDD
jgi:hypothetical protein